MTSIYIHQFDKANEEIDYLEYVSDISSEASKAKVFGVIGPITSGKNRFISDILIFRKWEKKCIIVDFSLYDSLDEIKKQFETVKGKSVLWLKNGEMKPHLLKGMMDDGDYINSFKFVIYSFVYELHEGLTIRLSQLSEEEIIPLFRSLSEYPSKFDLSLSDLKRKTIKAFRNVNLINDIANYLRDIKITDKQQLLDILWSWQDALWSNHRETTIPFFEIVKSVILSYIRDKEDFDYYLRVVVFLSYNGSSPISEQLIKILIDNDNPRHLETRKILDDLVYLSLITCDCSTGK